MNLKYFLNYFLVLIVSISNSLAQNINSIAGNGTAGNAGDGGLAVNAELQAPSGVAVDSNGNIYISSFNCIRKVNSLGIISTVAGSNAGLSGGSGNGGPATSALLNTPGGIAIDALGNIYFAEFWNNWIRKINTSGIISTVAGTGAAGFSGDGGLATSAKLNNPRNVAIDAFGNLYIADNNNRIRKVNTSGIINTIAGTGVAGYSGDGGPALSAQFDQPSGVVVDAVGNIYVSDYTFPRIRKIDISGNINTIAGTGVAGYSGDGGSATLAQIGGPMQLRIDAAGNLFIADYGYSTVRKVTQSGIISTVAGTGVSGYSGDGGPATLAKIGSPMAIEIDASGMLYIADSYGMRIRTVNLNTGINELEISNNISVYPNPASNVLNLIANGYEFENSVIEITNSLGQSILKTQHTNQIDVSKLSQGFYNLKITSQNNQIYYSKFVRE